MKRSTEDKPLVCRFCGRQLIAGDVCVRTAAGPMHAGCSDANRQQFEQAWDEALREGTHNEHPLQFCGICRAWVKSIYHIGFDGTRMCPVCADSYAGAGPRSFEKQQRERAEKWARQQQQRQVAG